MKDLYIYVIQLEENRIFIHHAYETKPDKLFLEFEIYYDYLKLYKPLHIIETILEKDDLQLDYIVKTYMYMHGYAYVRGGSYSDVELCKNTQFFIEKELTESVREYPNKYTPSYAHIMQTYVMRKWENVEEINDEHALLKTQFRQYLQEKLALDAVETYATPSSKKRGFVNNDVRINEYTLVEIQTLYDYCKANNSSDIYKMRKLYLNILPKIKHIIKIYMQKCEFPSTNPLYVKYMFPHPQFFLDSFFYQYSFSPPCPKDREAVDEVFGAILYFTNWVICHIQDLRFNLISYPYNIEWLYPRIFHILDKIKKNEIYTTIEESPSTQILVTDPPSVD